MNLNLWCSRQTLTQALHFSGKNVRLSSLPSSKTFLKTTELPWTNTTLSRGGRRKLFNSSLMNKLIRIEWMSAIRLPTKLMDVTSSMSKNVPGVCVCYKWRNICHCEERFSVLWSPSHALSDDIFAGLKLQNLYITFLWRHQIWRYNMTF